MLFGTGLIDTSGCFITQKRISLLRTQQSENNKVTHTYRLVHNEVVAYRSKGRNDTGA